MKVIHNKRATFLKALMRIAALFLKPATPSTAPESGGGLERLGGNPPDPNQAFRTPEAFPLHPEEIEPMHSNRDDWPGV